MDDHPESDVEVGELISPEKFEALTATFARLDAANREIKAAVDAGEIALEKTDERPCDGLEDFESAAIRAEAFARRLRCWRRQRADVADATRRRAVISRGALRGSAPRLGVRRHRRTARRLQKTGTDDGSSPEPPPQKLALAVCCGALAAGFAVGALAATVLP